LGFGSCWALRLLLGFALSLPWRLLLGFGSFWALRLLLGLAFSLP
jgi:hypothetical protein